MPTFIASPSNIAPGTTGSFQDVDITSLVGAFAGSVKVAHLRVSNSGASDRVYNVRANGSSDNRITQTIAAGTQHDRWVGVDSSDIFEAYIAHADVEIYLLGYYVTGEADFLTNAVNMAPATGAWNDCDISSHTSSVALCAFLEIVNTAASDRKYSIRMNGSTDDRSGRNCQTGHLMGAFAPLDGSEIFEMKNDGAIQAWLSCYAIDNVVFQTNASDISIGSAGSYVNANLSALAPDGANGAFVHFYNGTNANVYDWNIRAEGSSFAEYEAADLHVFVCSPIDVSRIAEIQIANTSLDTFFHGYSVPSAVDDSGSPTGVEGTGQVGTVATVSSAEVPVTGVSGAGQVGTVAVVFADGALPSGVSGTGQVGTVTTSGDIVVAVTGVFGTGQVGAIDIIAGLIVTVTGAQGTGAVGDVLTKSAYGVEGVSGVGSAGEVVVRQLFTGAEVDPGHVKRVRRTPNRGRYDRRPS